MLNQDLDRNFPNLCLRTSLSESVSSEQLQFSLFLIMEYCVGYFKHEKYNTLEHPR
jgi:hypothetical protein